MMRFKEVRPVERNIEQERLNVKKEEEENFKKIKPEKGGMTVEEAKLFWDNFFTKGIN